MIIARWHIDARFGHKQAVIESLRKWLRTTGAQIDWTEDKVRIATGSVGALESTVEVDVTLKDLAELNACWGRSPPIRSGARRSNLTLFPARLVGTCSE